MQIWWFKGKGQVFLGIVFFWCIGGLGLVGFGYREIDSWYLLYFIDFEDLGGIEFFLRI